jgi:hypothetical protein
VRADRDPELADDLLAVLDVLGGTDSPFNLYPAFAAWLRSAPATGLVRSLLAATASNPRGSSEWP